MKRQRVLLVSFCALGLGLANSVMAQSKTALFPAISGTFSVKITFNTTLPTSAKGAAGTLVIRQPSRQDSALNAEANIELELEDKTIFVTAVRQAHVDREGVVRFRLYAEELTDSTWAFYGTIGNRGEWITGKHVHTGFGGGLPGTGSWTATRKKSRE